VERNEEARCKVCGGYYGDSGHCVTLGCPGDSIKALWVELDAIEDYLSFGMEVSPIVEEIGDAELKKLRDKLDEAADKMTDVVHDMQLWCKKQNKE